MNIAFLPKPQSVVYGEGQLSLDKAAVRSALLGGDVPKVATIIDPTAVDGPEAYMLKVGVEGVEIVAGGPAGRFYALQTLLQMFPADSEGLSSIPLCEIEDAPRFAWRGLMLDTSRHFMPVAFLEKFLDTMAMHKFNVLHFHATDDQGWRLQIDAYPELAKVGGYRSETLVGHASPSKRNGPKTYDGIPHSGYYTKADVKHLVEYAAARFIDIVPEIEMPGHAQSVLASHPELSCTGGPFEVSKTWGIHHEVYCAGNEDVFTLLQQVLVETMEMFPSPFIHVGGDECVKERWKECPKCQARIKSEGLADEHELQSWFIRRMDKFLIEHGRRLIGWDEILEGGLATGAAVMSWRSQEGGITAAKRGHDVVMAPQKVTYFDYYQGNPETEPLAIGGDLPLQKVYEHDPIPAELNAEEARHIMGVQGQLWTEYIPTPESVEYMAFPRACALAEVAWGTNDLADYAGFEERLKTHLGRLDAAGVNYRRLD